MLFKALSQSSLDDRVKVTSKEILGADAGLVEDDLLGRSAGRVEKGVTEAVDIRGHRPCASTGRLSGAVTGDYNALHDSRREEGGQ